MTFDHSLVWEMQAAGQIPRDQVPDLIPRNIITRSLGPNPTVQVDIEGPFPIEPGDVYLVCSDGLSGLVSDEEIGTLMGQLPPNEAAQTLIDLANLRGGNDNITVIVVRVLGPLTAAPRGAPVASASSFAPVRPIHPMLWTFLGVSALASIAMVVMKLWLATVITLAIFVATGIFAFIRHYGGSRRSFSSGGQVQGKAPYTTCDCAPESQGVQLTAAMLDQLHQAITREKWAVDGNQIEPWRQKARLAEQQEDFTQAVVCQLRVGAVSQLKQSGQWVGDPDTSRT